LTQSRHQNTFDGPVTNINQADIINIHPSQTSDGVEFPQFVGVPGQRTFVGRTKELEALARVEDSGVVVCQVAAGMGGVGKSALVLEYVHRQRASCGWVGWVTAGGRAVLVDNLAGLASSLRVPAGEDAEATAVGVVRALEGLKERWLLVIDNVTDPGEIDGLIPQSGNGQVLVTSRHRHWESIPVRLVPVGMLQPDDAVELLCHLGCSDDRRSAGVLAERLGFLALAVEQAGATIGQRGWTFDYYHRLLDDQPARSYNHVVQGLDRTVAQVLTAAVAQCAADAPLAVPLLGVCAYLDAVDIPRHLFEGNPAVGEFLANGDPFQIGDAIAALTRYHLLRADAETGTLHVHRLVQELTRLGHHDDPTYQDTAVKVVLDTHPKTQGDPSHYATARDLANHVTALAATTTPSTNLAVLLNWSGALLQEGGYYPLARAHHQQAYNLRREVLGDRHPDTLTSLNNLAGILDAQGELDTARPLYQQAYDLRREVLGDHHPNTLTSLNNLAFIMQAQGELDTARPLYQQAYDLSREVLGDHHPDTLGSLNNLAGIMLSQG
jgi:tetratricopeptide (TPR) repeat protein